MKDQRQLPKDLQELAHLMSALKIIADRCADRELIAHIEKGCNKVDDMVLVDKDSQRVDDKGKS